MAQDQASPELRIGCSGWQYDHWKGVFYPEDLRKEDWFSWYARHFDTVEINNTFYHLPDAEVFDRWREAAPEGFLYALKFSRYGTHLKRLRDPAEPIERFLNRATRLEEHLGQILVQLPPRWKVNPDRLAGFLNAIPPGHRWAFEFRDPSWLCREVFDLLQEHHAALCLHDLIEDHPEEITSDWVYLRFHGGDYTKCYTSGKLTASARRIDLFLSAGLDVYAYFNNDASGYAVKNAQDLRSRFPAR